MYICMYVYDFCKENINLYEKTILSLGISYGIAPIYTIKKMTPAFLIY